MSFTYTLDTNEKAEIIARKVFKMIAEMEYHSSKNDIPDVLDEIKQSLSADLTLYPKVLTELQKIFEESLDRICNQHVHHSSSTNHIPALKTS